jgi:hypothetical protein
MKLPFNDCAIEFKNEKLPVSQKVKVDQLNQEWSSNPLSACSINH